jgi:hypothetical protein
MDLLIRGEHSMKRSSLAVRVLLLIVTILASTVMVEAQFRASLRGTVTDSSGAVVPGATVTLVDKGTNKTLTSTTDDNGIYIFNALPAAPYQLTVERQGFQKKVLENVQIIPEQLNSLNLEVAVGGNQQSVNVTDAVQALDTETATMSATISSNQIQHMPSFNRDVFQLAQLTPGVFGDAAQGKGGGSSANPGNQGPGGTSGGNGGIFQTENGPQIQSGGGQYETNGISIDGISTVSAVWGGTSIITPSEDSVQDMKVVSNGYDAEYGRFSGAQIQVTSKSGTNQLHGSAFFKASRPGLNAYQRWNGLGSDQIFNSDGTRKTPAERGLNRDSNRFNQYGGSLGGPIWKNKIFAFFNWETSPLKTVSPSQGWYETSQFHSLVGGPIANQYLGFPGSGVAGGSIVSRNCASVGLTEGSNCATVAGGLDLGSPLTTGVGNQDLTYGGGANTPGVGGGLDGIPDLAFFTAENPTTTSQMQFNGRVDANLTSNDRLAFAIYWVPLTSTNYNGTIRPQNLWHHDQTNDAFSLIWDHTFSPTLLNQLRGNAAGWRWNEVATNPQAPFGLPQANFDNIGSANPQFMGAPGPSNLNQWTYSYNDVLTKVLGRHSVKAGGEYTRLYYLNNPVYAARPGYTFHNLWDFLNDAPYSESGQFDHSTGIPFANRQDDRENLWGVFIQDDFKIRPNLTINLGLRWSYFGAFYSKQDNLDVLQFGSGANTLSGLNIRVGGKLYDPQKTNFGPMIGFAWSPNLFENKLVLRGGFGISYNQNEIAITANGNGNPPNAVNASYSCTYPYTTNPTCAGTGILYETAGDVHSIFGYAPNPTAITAFGSNNLPLSGTTNVTGFPSSPKSISNAHYSLGMQYQLPFNSVMSLGYQGNQTRHLLTQNNFNVVASAANYPLNPVVKFLDYYENNGNANFNAMIASLNHTFSHSFQATAQYTWSKAMDENSGPYSEDQYPFDPHAAYGRADYNVGQAFKLYGMWQPVFFHGNNWLEKVVGGWSLSGIWNLHTGFPWNPVYNTTGDIYYGGSGYGSLRPGSVIANYGRGTANMDFMQATNPNFSGNGTNYFVGPTYVTGASFPAYGAVPVPGIQRNSLNGPGYNDVDATLSKAFGLPNNKVLGENAKFEIRADIYNLFNKLNLNTQRIDNNLGQVAPNGTIVSINHDFGVAGEALGSRTIQLQARFSF